MVQLVIIMTRLKEVWLIKEEYLKKRTKEKKIHFQYSCWWSLNMNIDPHHMWFLWSVHTDWSSFLPCFLSSVALQLSQHSAVLGDYCSKVSTSELFNFLNYSTSYWVLISDENGFQNLQKPFFQLKTFSSRNHSTFKLSSRLLALKLVFFFRELLTV